MMSHVAHLRRVEQINFHCKSEVTVVSARTDTQTHRHTETHTHAYSYTVAAAALTVERIVLAGVALVYNVAAGGKIVRLFGRHPCSIVIARMLIIIIIKITIIIIIITTTTTKQHHHDGHTHMPTRSKWRRLLAAHCSERWFAAVVVVA